MTFTKKQDNGYTQVLLSKNRKGYQNLSKLSSIGLIDGAYYVPRIDKQLLKEYKAKYQGCEKSTSKYSDQYDKLIIEAMGGKGDNDVEKEDKIIRNIAKTVTIDKK